MNERTVLVHHHIMKNAGVSIEAVLRDAFGTRWAPFDPTSELGHAVHIAHLASFLDAQPEVRAVSSHVLRPPRFRLGNVRLMPLVFLRDPIVRTASLWSFLARQDPSDPSASVARHEGFAGFVRMHLDRDRATGIEDGQAQMLAGVCACCPEHRWRPPASEIVARARAAFAELPVIGVVEQYARSMSRFAEWLGDLFPSVRWEPRHLHAGEHGLTSREAVAEALGMPLYRRLVAANELDDELYREALARLETPPRISPDAR